MRIFIPIFKFIRKRYCGLFLKRLLSSLLDLLGLIQVYYGGKKNRDPGSWYWGGGGNPSGIGCAGEGRYCHCGPGQGCFHERFSGTRMIGRFPGQRRFEGVFKESDKL